MSDVSELVSGKIERAIRGNVYETRPTGELYGVNEAVAEIVALPEITTLQSTVSRLREAIVELWHESEAGRGDLHEYLGMTWEEYCSWVEGKDIQSMKDGN